MSVSPPKDGEAAADASPENSDNQMSRDQEGPAREPYDFDVKEQDRWLPIANGRSKKFSLCSPAPFRHSTRTQIKKEMLGLFFLRGYLTFRDKCMVLEVSGGKRVACENWQGT